MTDKPSIVYTVGTFDLLHVGHLALLEQCSMMGDILAVGVASDSVVNSYKPNVPVIPLDQRQEMLKALSCVDIVRPYHELEYVSACVDLNVSVFVVGEDWGSNSHNIDVERYLNARGKKIVKLVYSPRTSSTSIKNNVRAQKIIPKVDAARNTPINAKSINHYGAAALASGNRDLA